MNYDNRVRDNIYKQLNIISDYGKAIEETTFGDFLARPKSALPYDYDTIRRALKTIFIILHQPIYREEINKWNDDICEYLLSDKFVEQLKVGYMFLADFIDDEDANLAYISFVNFVNIIGNNVHNDNHFNSLVNNINKSAYYSNVSIRELSEDEKGRVENIRNSIIENRKILIEEIESLENLTKL